MKKQMEIRKEILTQNDKVASSTRDLLDNNKVFAINLVSSPGSGKTCLLERTLRVLKDRIRMAVIAGDVQTENDARRLEATEGGLVISVVTGGACHLDAAMVRKALDKIDLNEIDLLFVENVGNLVCPSMYDLGEDMKVVLVSTTEGDDKPLKYPAMFRNASVLVWNKIDLLGQSDFDLGRAKQNARIVNADLKMFDISCRTEDGMANWYTWLNNQVAAKRGAYPP